MELIDSHAHLSSDALHPEIDSILERAQKANIRAIIDICTDRATLERGIELAKKYPCIALTASTTPHDVDTKGESDFDFIADCARKGLLKAVGETGLDYHYEHSPRELQKQFLIRYFHLAMECKLPVVIHCREAFADFFKILDAEYAGPGVLHCFTGTLEEAQEVIKRGWMLSLSGIVTFKKSVELQDVARKVPLEQLLIETDSPYLAPQGHRGKINEPSFLVETAAFIAALKGISLAELARATTQNARKLFSI